MRILQVFNQYLQRGGEEVWVEKIPGLAGEDFEFEELRFRSAEWVGEGAPARLKQARWIGDNPQSRERLCAAAEQFRPDALLFHNLIPVASLGLYDEARRLGLPVIQYIHNFRPFSPGGRLWVRGRVEDAAMRGNPWPEIRAGSWNGSALKTAVLAWHLGKLRRSGALDEVRAWITISEAMRRCFVDAGVAAERVVTLRHCWEVSDQPADADEGDYYLFLGGLHASKGVHTLLGAWRVLEEQLGEECPRLVIAGEGPLEDCVREFAANSKCIEPAGFVDGGDKRKLLAGSRALIVPSIWWEPLGLVVYEAYEHSRPVISSGSGGLAETVEVGRTGLLHGVNDPASLADAVQRMERAGRQGRTEMGRNGRAWMEDEASPVEWRRRLKEIVAMAIGTPGG
jgi:glycosyltransferase involved in cell wall biosynthesis